MLLTGLCLHPCSHDRPSSLRVPLKKKDRCCFPSLQSSPVSFIRPTTIASHTLTVLPGPLPPDYFCDHSDPAPLGSTNLLPVLESTEHASFSRPLHFLSFLCGILLLQIFSWLCPLFPSGVCPNVVVSEETFQPTLYVMSYSPAKISSPHNTLHFASQHLSFVYLH